MDIRTKAERHADAIEAAIQAAEADGFRVVPDDRGYEIDLDLHEGAVYRFTITTLEPLEEGY